MVSPAMATLYSKLIICSTITGCQFGLLSPSGSCASEHISRSTVCAIVMSRYYDEARASPRWSRRLSSNHDDARSSSSPAAAPASWRPATAARTTPAGQSIGLNIVLPHEQEPNPYITPELCFQFHYFALRKMHFLMRAMALVCFPGRLRHARRAVRGDDADADRQGAQAPDRARSAASSGPS